MKLSVLVLFLLSSASGQAVPMDAAKGKIEFLAIGKPSAIRIKGEGKGPTGQFEIKKVGAELKLSAELIVDLETLDTGIGLRDRHMKEKYLETAKFKTATLKITQASLPASASSGSGTFTVPGTLKIKDVEKPVDIAVSLETSGDNIKSVSTFKLNLADYAIDIPKYAGITVANDVEVKVETLVAKADLKETK